MSISYVGQRGTTWINSTGSLSRTLTLLGATANNLLIASLVKRVSNGAPSVSAGWTLLGHVAGAGATHTLWYRIATGDSGDDITTTWGDTGEPQLTVWEYTGNTTIDVLDSVVATRYAFGTVNTLGSLTPDSSAGAMISVLGNPNSLEWRSNGPFIDVGTRNDKVGGTSWDPLQSIALIPYTSTAAIDPTWSTTDTGGAALGIQVCFKEPGGGSSPVSNTITSSFTALAVASQAITLPHESNQNLEALLAPAFESVVYFDDAKAANLESLIALTAEQAPLFNALATINTSQGGALESLLQTAAQAQPALELLAERVGTVGVNFESGASALAVSNPISSSFTALAVASHAITLPHESTQNLEALLAPAFESVVFVSGVKAASIESLHALTAEQATPINSLATINASQGGALESLLKTGTAASPATESLVKAVSSIGVNYESDSASLAVSNSIDVALTSLAQSTNSLSVNFETNITAIAVSNSASIALESLQGLEHFSEAPYAVLRGFARGIDGNLEAVATLVVAGDAAAEALISTGNGFQVNVEILQLLQQASAVPIEAAGIDFIPSYLDLVMLLSDEVNINAPIIDEINLF